MSNTLEYAEKEMYAHDVDELQCKFIKNKLYENNCTQRYFFIHNLREIFRSGELSDVILKVDNTEYRAHKLILAMSSSYFRRMFQSGFVESCESIVKLPFDPITFELILKFIYEDSINLNIDNIFDIMEIENILCINSLKAIICDFIAETNYYKPLLTFQRSQLYNYVTLHNEVDFFIKENFQKILESDDIKEISWKCLFHFISSDFLYINDYDIFLIKLIEWILYDESDRSKYIENILGIFSPDNFRKINETFDAIKALLDHNSELLNRILIWMNNCIEYRSGSTHLFKTKQYKDSCVPVVFSCGGCTTEAVNTIIATYYPKQWTRLIPDTHYIFNKQHDNSVSVALGSMNNARFCHMSANNFKTIFVVNGFNKDTPPVGKYPDILLEFPFELGSIQSTEMYNVYNNTWTLLPSLNECVQFGSLVCVGDYLYLSGGLIKNNASFKINKSTCMLLETKNGWKWKYCSNMITPRCGHSFINLDDMLYVFGGFKINKMTGKLELLLSIEYFDSRNDSWSKFCNLSTLTGLHTIVALKTNLYLITEKNIYKYSKFNLHGTELVDYKGDFKSKSLNYIYLPNWAVFCSNHVVLVNDGQYSCSFFSTCSFHEFKWFSYPIDRYASSLNTLMFPSLVLSRD